MTCDVILNDASTSYGSVWHFIRAFCRVLNLYNHVCVHVPSRKIKSYYSQVTSKLLSFK